MIIERLIGEAAIAAHLAVSEGTVRAWGELSVDPLPLRTWEGSVIAWPPYLDEWLARRDDLAAWRVRRPRGEPGLPILVGWEAIAAAFPIARTIETAERAVRVAWRPLPVIGDRLPAERLPREGGPPRVWMYRSAHRDWSERLDLPYAVGAARQRQVAPSPQLSLIPV